MRVSHVLSLIYIGTALSFSPRPTTLSKKRAPQLLMSPPGKRFSSIQDEKLNIKNHARSLYKIAAGIALTTTLCLPINAPLLTPHAAAKEMASGSGSRVNKDPESLLRYGLPIANKDVRAFIGHLLLALLTRQRLQRFESYKESWKISN